MSLWRLACAPTNNESVRCTRVSLEGSFDHEGSTVAVICPRVRQMPRPIQEVFGSSDRYRRHNAAGARHNLKGTPQRLPTTQGLASRIAHNSRVGLQPRSRIDGFAPLANFEIQLRRSAAGVA